MISQRELILRTISYAFIISFYNYIIDQFPIDTSNLFTYVIPAFGLPEARASSVSQPACQSISKSNLSHKFLTQSCVIIIDRQSHNCITANPWLSILIIRFFITFHNKTINKYFIGNYDKLNNDWQMYTNRRTPPMIVSGMALEQRSWVHTLLVMNKCTWLIEMREIVVVIAFTTNCFIEFVEVIDIANQ